MRRVYLWGALAVLAAVGAGIAIGQGPSASAATPVASTTTSSPPTTSTPPTPVQIGAQLYTANCQTCHGKNGQGGKDRGIGGEGLRSFSRFKDLILYGRERMPGYAKTGLSTSDSLGSLGSKGYLGNSSAPTDQQIQDLLAYLKTLPASHRSGFFGGGDD
jgi:mono/diheme cytochrome c family protein